MRLTPEHQQHLQDLIDLCDGNVFMNDYAHGEICITEPGGLQKALDFIKDNPNIPYELTYDELCDENYVYHLGNDLRDTTFD